MNESLENQNPEYLESNRELFDLVTADQNDRRSLDYFNQHAEEITEHDTERRKRLRALIEKGALQNRYDYYSAALILQHGLESKDYKEAVQYARIAHEMGHEDAGWLCACTEDRYLMSIGKLQKYGTQYQPKMVPGPDGDDIPDVSNYVLMPVDPDTTDEERLELGARTLAEAQEYAKTFNRPRAD